MSETLIFSERSCLRSGWGCDFCNSVENAGVIAEDWCLKTALLRWRPIYLWTVTHVVRATTHSTHILWTATHILQKYQSYNFMLGVYNLKTVEITALEPAWRVVIYYTHCSVTWSLSGKFRIHFHLWWMKEARESYVWCVEALFWCYVNMRGVWAWRLLSFDACVKVKVVQFLLCWGLHFLT